jgi:hypothetical protein
MCLQRGCPSKKKKIQKIYLCRRVHEIKLIRHAKCSRHASPKATEHTSRRPGQFPFVCTQGRTKSVLQALLTAHILSCLHISVQGSRKEGGKVMIHLRRRWPLSTERTVSQTTAKKKGKKSKGRRGSDGRHPTRSGQQPSRRDTRRDTGLDAPRRLRDRTERGRAISGGRK